jgi:hypothetical protein
VRIEDLTVDVRPRPAPQAVDLGIALVQRWWRAVYGPLLLLMAPLALLALGLTAAVGPALASLLVWWLKPVYDRLVLHVLSRAVFGATPGPREALGGMWRRPRTDLVLALTLRRLDPRRSFRLPVTQLEGLRGKARRLRVAVLDARGGGQATLLTLVWLHLEAALNLSLLIALVWLVPDPWAADYLEVFGAAGPDDPFAYLTVLVYLTSVTFMEPFYVGAGFALYLNRRSHLEGWDIELAFRRLARRLRSPAQSAAAAALLAPILALVLALSCPSPAEAAEPPSPERIRATVEAVLANPDFATEREVTRWVPKDRDEEEKDLEDHWRPAGPSGLSRVVLWVAGAVLAVVLLWLALQHGRIAAVLGRPARRRQARAPAPTTLMGMDLRPESLPADVPAAARAHWRAGEHRAALGLLYRGALSVCANDHHLPLPASATETEVLEAAREGLPASALGWLAGLTAAWTATAYAHRPPPEARFAALCDGYREALAGAPSELPQTAP